MRRIDAGLTLGAISVLIICLAAGGWVANIVKLAHMSFDNIGGMLVLRAVGIIVAPLGAVLGFC